MYWLFFPGDIIKKRFTGYISQVIFQKRISVIRCISFFTFSRNYVDFLDRALHIN